MKKLLISLILMTSFSSWSMGNEVYEALLLTEGDNPQMETSFVVNVAPYSVVQFRLWIYNENASRGLTGFELGIDFNIGTCMEASVNPGVTSVVGDISSTAFAGVFDECRNTQFVWISKYSMYYLGTPHYVNTVPYSETGNYIVSSCEEGNPKYPLLEGNQFGINICPDADSSSWGVVKSLFR